MPPAIPNSTFGLFPATPSMKPAFSHPRGPRTASRMLSLNAPTLSSMYVLALSAISSAGYAGADAAQPSPYITTSGSMACRRSLMRFMVSMSWMAMRSNLNPSMWYSFIHHSRDSTMYLRNISCSDAVSLPQPEPSKKVPSSRMR